MNTRSLLKTVTILAIAASSLALSACACATKKNCGPAANCPMVQKCCPAAKGQKCPCPMANCPMKAKAAACAPKAQ